MTAQLRVDDAAPWKRRYRAPAILWTQLARGAPTRGLTSTSRSGVYQLYAWDVPTAQLTQLTDRPEGVPFGQLSPDGRYVAFLDDAQGNEIGHYVRVPFEGGEPEDLTPGLPLYSSFDLGVSLAGNRAAFIAVGVQGFQFYCLDLGQDGTVGGPRLLHQSKRLTSGVFLSQGGEIAVIGSTERTRLQHYSLVAFDATSGARIAELWDGPESSIRGAGFSPVAGDQRMLAATNRSGVRRPLVWNPRTGERVDLALTDLSGDVVPVDWSPDGRRILLCQHCRAVQQLYVYDLIGHSLQRLEHPPGTFDSGSGDIYWGPEGDIYARWQDSTHPSQLIALDGETGAHLRTVLAAGEVPPGHPWRSITFSSSDGEGIQGWLGLPDGEGPFPTILETHGGPEYAVTEAFSPGAQAWLDHGYAYLMINFRGSTTFGRAFQEQIWGNLGHWEVEDMAAARAWLVDQGIARPNQILLTGRSYGGYLTLLALGKRPDLWAGGMAVVAVADWAVMYEDSADTLRGYMAALFGGTPEEKPEQYAASSPITYVEDVAAPILIIQGHNDTRTTPRPVRAYEGRMRSLGKPIEVVWFDAGHAGWAQVELSIDHQELMLRFAYRVLGLNGA
jgi:dipeptidyl aminopeptidase/acylaminoacyl peptidase